MFCAECGAKNKNTDAFCCECGAPLEQEEVKNNVVEKPRQPMSKKNKIIIAVIATVVIVLGIGYKVGSDYTNPKKVAEEYISALIKKDSDKLYKYLEIDGDKTFVTKKIFNDVVEKKLTTSDVENYVITDVTYSDGDLTATVTFKYTEKGSSSERTSKVDLTKQKDKKFLIFDNWKVNDTGATSTIIEDYTVKVTKGSKLTYAGVKVTDKYKDKKNSTSSLDVYVLPQVFKVETTIKAVLPSGLEIEETVTPSTYYNTHTVSFDEDSLTEEAKEKIITSGKNFLTTVYENAMKETAFADIKSNFEHKGIDLADLETSYTNLVNDLKNASNKLTSIGFNTTSIYDIDLTDEGYLEVELRLNYDYSIKYTNYSDEEVEHSDSDYDCMTVILTYDDGKYYLVDLGNDLEDYFSRY